MIHTYSAIVLRPTPFQDGDSLVVSFLSEYGERLVGFARAAKRPSSKWVASFEPLNLVNLSLFGKDHTEVHRVTRCDLVHSPLILGHLESNLVVACLADIFDRIAKPGVEDTRLFRLLSVCTYTIKLHPERAMAILAYSEYWVLHCLGLLPHSRLCGYCGSCIEPLVRFEEKCGWCCSACTHVRHQLAFPIGVREHLLILKTCSATEAPDPNINEASIVITNVLRKRLKSELGNVQSYIILEQALATSKR